MADDQRQRQAAEYVQGRNEGVASGVTVGDMDWDMREPVGYNEGHACLDHILTCVPVYYPTILH